MSTLIQSIPLASTEITILNRGWDLTPSFGGPDQRISLFGASRWIGKFTSENMRYEQGMAFVASLLDGLSGKVRFAIPQPGFTGSNTTASSGSGRSLTVASATGLKPGQYISIVSGGVRYLHNIRAVAGTVLTIHPALRIASASGSVVEVVSPQIEGFILENSVTYVLSQLGGVTVSWAIKEAA